jgi:hypothetical protein
MQRQDDDALSPPRLEIYAAALARLCEELHHPLVWPVGPAAERLAGAATLFGGGAMRVRGWMSNIDGEHVLVMTLHSLTPLPLLHAAEQARRLGAAKVTACAIHLGGVADLSVTEAIDAFRGLPVDAALLSAA